MEEILNIITNGATEFDFFMVIRLLILCMFIECIGLLANAFASIGRGR